MRWLKEHGLISNFEDYLSLPLKVINHARLLAEAQADLADAKVRHAKPGSGL